MTISTSDPTVALISEALDEDAPEGDLTSALVVPVGAVCEATLRAKQDGVLAGTAAATWAFTLVGRQDGIGGVEVVWSRTDGDRIAVGDVLATIRGPARSILRAERVAVNVLAHLSGVATITRAYVDAAEPASVLCTRKTLPGLRVLEREAVLAGGGRLHRASLSDAVLIKDNHLRVSGSITEAISHARVAGLPIEVEVETTEQLDEALEAGADRILLDNATPEFVRDSIARAGDPDRLEVSGGITLETIGAFAAAGARWISVGRLTHSAPSLDVSLEVAS